MRGFGVRQPCCRRAGRRPAGKPARVTTTHVFVRFAHEDVRAARGRGGIPSGCPRKHGFRTPYLLPFSGAGGEAGKLGCVDRAHGSWWKPRAHCRAPLPRPARRPAGKPARVTTTHVFEHVADEDVRAPRGPGLHGHGTQQMKTHPPAVRAALSYASTPCRWLSRRDHRGSRSPQLAAGTPKTSGYRDKYSAMSRS
ncbi:hypothetical protein HRbin30_03045 [bacterium HR30]|nr:hypothetical protein HRbin30_03045 [bacterium HR30]